MKLKNTRKAILRSMLPIATTIGLNLLQSSFPSQQHIPKDWKLDIHLQASLHIPFIPKEENSK